MPKPETEKMNKISIIAACSKNRVIGKDGKIPWSIRADMEHFKQITTGGVVIMGRRTFEEILNKLGSSLPGRETIVLSSTRDFSGAHYQTARSLEEAVSIARAFCDKEIFICGGEAVYREAIQKTDCNSRGNDGGFCVDRIYLTLIDAEIEGDAFFPELTAGFRLAECSKVSEASASGAQIDFEFQTYERSERKV